MSTLSAGCVSAEARLREGRNFLMFASRDGEDNFFFLKKSDKKNEKGEKKKLLLESDKILL